jgi:hypothetical protein
VRHLYRTEDVAQVLTIIADVSGGVARLADRPSPSPSATTRPNDAPVIESVSAITDRRLETYLASRAIPLELARMYLQEVRYRVGERSFQALGFSNNA